jgi:predicted acetyltransferase
MREVETRRAVDPGDLEALAPIVGWAFGGGTTRALDWLRAAGLAQVRIASVGGVISGGLVEIPMGQWFGGQSVPTLGLAGVAIAPEARGHGVGLELLRRTLRSARERGIALSTLYPSTFGLYRKAGYELAGSFCRFTLQLRQLARSSRTLPVVSLGEEWHSGMEGAYRQVARQHAGYLDRGPYVWNRVRRPELEPARAYGVLGAEGLEGYLYVRMTTPARMPLELTLSDFVVQSGAALSSLLGFLADHSTTAERAVWSGGPADARLLGVPERVVRTTVEDYWMLRLLDVRGALLGRGYPELDAALDLEVADEFLPENSGVYPLVVQGGVARLESTASGRRARLSVGALAALYSGFVSPRQLLVTGQLEADDRALAALGALFAGPAPGLADFF